jgi:hypothetical protein
MITDLLQELAKATSALIEYHFNLIAMEDGSMPKGAFQNVAAITSPRPFQRSLAMHTNFIGSRINIKLHDLLPSPVEKG